MDDFVLCDIPIYSESKDRFFNKFLHKRVVREKELKTKNYDDDLIRIILDKEFTTYSIWKYNQMIGFIEVVIYKNKDIELKLYMSDQKKHLWNSQHKYYMKYIQILGMHNYTEGKSNNEIKEDILELYNDLKEWHLKGKNLYFDETNLKIILKYTNIKKIIEDVTK